MVISIPWRREFRLEVQTSQVQIKTGEESSKSKGGPRSWSGWEMGNWEGDGEVGDGRHWAYW